MDMSFAWIEFRPGVSNLGCDMVMRQAVKDNMS